MVVTEIVEGKISPFPSDDSHTTDGAEIVFNGRVRNVEHESEIVALDYEQYEGMALQELQNLAQETVDRFPIHDLLCRHRVGEIPVGETALHVSIRSEHREEGLKAITWFVSELKDRVPIWKWVILPDGSRHASRSAGR